MLPRRMWLVVALWLGAAAISAEPLISLASIPCVNLTSYQGRLLERRAAAAVAAAAPTPWASVDPVRVQAALAELGAPAPLGTAEIQALCNRLPAAMAVTGAVSTAESDGSAARVVLHLEFTEPLSGELVARVQAEGKAKSREPQPRDALLEQALAAAAQTAFKQLGRSPWVLGQVTEATAEDTVSLHLIAGAKPPPKAVVLLLEASGVIPVAAAAVVETVQGTTAQVRILGRRQEALAGGEVAVCVGRLP